MTANAFYILMFIFTLAGFCAGWPVWRWWYRKNLIVTVEAYRKEYMRLLAKLEDEAYRKARREVSKSK